MLQRIQASDQATSGSCGALFNAEGNTDDNTDDNTVFAVSAVTVGPQISWLSAAGKLVGEAAAADLSDALDRQWAIGCRFVWLDLSRVSLLDRASFDVLTEAHERFLTVGGTLVLTGVGRRIARLLELTGHDETFFTTATQSDPHPDPPRLHATNGRSVHEQTTIDRAVGVVMGRTRCGVEEAVEQLLVLGQATNRTLREVAQSILDESTRTRNAGAVAGPAPHLPPDRRDRRRHRAWL